MKLFCAGIKKKERKENTEEIRLNYQCKENKIFKKLADMKLSMQKQMTFYNFYNIHCTIYRVAFQVV